MTVVSDQSLETNAFKGREELPSGDLNDSVETVEPKEFSGKSKKFFASRPELFPPVRSGGRLISRRFCGRKPLCEIFPRPPDRPPPDGP